MTKTELKKKTKDELIEIVEKQGIILTEYNDYFTAFINELKNKIKEQYETIKKLMNGEFVSATVGKMFEKSLSEREQEICHETCEAIRDQFIYKNGTKEYDCDYDISSKRLNSFLCELDGVGDDWKDEN